MKKITIIISGILSLGYLFSCNKESGSGPTPPPTSDSFIVTVNNGYGSGKYKSGDTVHIFSVAYGTDQLFNTWRGDISLLQSPNEWHTWFIMPNNNITLTGSLEGVPDFTLQYEQIKGKSILKPVYYYFPQNEKGLVYLLHGTNGNAANIMNSYEWQQMIKDLVNNQFGVMITEAEESTLNSDTNGDGKIRWDLLPYDTTSNIDFANIRIITDTFYNRRVISRTTPRYSIGMSDGGFFSGALSSIYNFKAGVQYCAQGSTTIIQNTTVPIQFCMARKDDNPSVGTAGDAQALSNYQALNARGVCSKFFINERSPLYPERFARSGDIPLTLSVSVFNELKSNGYIDNKNYFIGYPDSLTSAVQNNPSNFPVIKSLSFNQLNAMLSEINIAVADHHIYSDYNRATLKFLTSQCQ
ncbi:MAG: hypothetical protein JST17_15365 [Bacteroidetes bacterium]|nr:hypothetical protein [Bacteroidota bacterium]MBS1930563.1 hypothetical protein [Bacteroidota bacterium]